MRSEARYAVEVPEFLGDWYRGVVDFAGGTPGFVQDFMAHFTELGIIALMGVWAVMWWRTRAAPSRAMALALLGPVGVVVAYALSEGAKVLVDEERPCRTFADVSIIAQTCPPTGDWSFPSNHSTINGALVIAIMMVSWRVGLVMLPFGMLGAFSRVFVGVHYPHDVLVGFLLGAAVTAVLVLALAGPVTRLVEALRANAALARLLVAGGQPPPAPAPPLVSERIGPGLYQSQSSSPRRGDEEHTVRE
ncbi:phosphatase PAP2 family protein [Luedemannella helvata]|uniref:Phosphatidic acid phosphatase type 2/haloperoxidase domain-containing protein n=1 Tax=Luedemannella helvata TaxID=349315 RepID=A0ABP4VYR7_9ACTN